MKKKKTNRKTKLSDIVLVASYLGLHLCLCVSILFFVLTELNMHTALIESLEDGFILVIGLCIVSLVVGIVMTLIEKRWGRK